MAPADSRGRWLDPRETAGLLRTLTLSDRAIICSQLYADAYDLSTTKTLDSQAQAQVGVSPAHLSMNEVLTDTPMTWLALGEPSESAPGRP